MEYPAYIKTLLIISGATIIIPLITVALLKELKPFPLLIVFAGYTEMMNGILALNGINNHWLLSVYTWIEWMAFIYVLLDYSDKSKFFILIPAIWGAWLLPYEEQLTQVEMRTTLAFMLFVILYMAINRVKIGSDFILLAGIAFYCVGSELYSNDAFGLEYFAYVNITTNLIYTAYLGVQWAHSRRLQSYLESHYSSPCVA